MKFPPSTLVLLLWVLNVQAIRNSNRPRKENRALQAPEAKKSKANDVLLDCGYMRDGKGKRKGEHAGCEPMPSTVPMPSAAVAMPWTTAAPFPSPLDTVPNPPDLSFTPPSPRPSSQPQEPTASQPAEDETGETLVSIGPSSAAPMPWTLDTVPSPSDSPFTPPTPRPSSPSQEPTGSQPADDESAETQGSVGQEGGLVSSCKEEPPATTDRVTTTVKYEYVAFVTKGANIQDILAAVEKGTHIVYTSELLVCNFTRRMLKENYGYTTVYSAPLDEANPNKVCVNPPDTMTQDCYIVNGAATFEHLPGNPDSALVDNQVDAILTDSYDGGSLLYVHEDLVQLNFVSIVEVTTTGTDTTGGDDPAGSNNGGDDTSDGADRSVSHSAIGVSVAVAIAAAGLVLVGFLIFHRRRSRVVHNETLDDKGTLAEDGELSTDSLSYESPNAPVLNDELDDDASYIHLERKSHLSQYDLSMTHDSEWCLTLPAVFVETDVDLTRSYSEVGLERYTPVSLQRSYVVPNTVDL